MSGLSSRILASRRASGPIPSNLESTRKMRSMRRRASSATESAPSQAASPPATLTISANLRLTCTRQAVLVTPGRPMLK